MGDHMTTVATLALLATLSSGPSAPGDSLAVGQEKPRGAQAAGPSDSDAIRRRVKEGQKVRVTDDQGREWQGRIDTLAPDKLVLLTKARQRQDVPYGTIVRIDRPHDSLANGALIGFAAGAVYGLAVVIAEETNECDPGAFFSCGDPTASAYVLVPAVLGGLGAAIGVGIDALIHKDPTLFRRADSHVMLAPAVGRGVRGVTVSVRW
jgi:hypothetical protein